MAPDSHRGRRGRVGRLNSSLVGATGFEPATFRPPAERLSVSVLPEASRMSYASTSVDDLDRSDVAVGTKVVPRRSRVRSGGPICLSERPTENRRKTSLVGEEGPLIQISPAGFRFHAIAEVRWDPHKTAPARPNHRRDSPRGWLLLAGGTRHGVAVQVHPLLGRPIAQTAGTGRRSSTSTPSTENPPSRSRSASSFPRSRARSGAEWRASQKM
jgi:hypothetical protein